MLPYINSSTSALAGGQWSTDDLSWFRSSCQCSGFSLLGPGSVVTLQQRAGLCSGDQCSSYIQAADDTVAQTPG